MRRLGRISDESQYEDNGLQRSDHPVANFTTVIAQPASTGNPLYPNARDPNLARKSMPSLVLPEQTMSLHLNNLNEPPVSGAEDADVVCTALAVKNEWETAQGASRARYSTRRAFDKAPMMSFASEKGVPNGNDFISIFSIH